MIWHDEVKSHADFETKFRRLPRSLLIQERPEPEQVDTTNMRGRHCPVAAKYVDEVLD